LLTDPADLEFVSTSSGEFPTPENSSPLDGGDGRGSCVWFNQATMFQTGELGFSTIEKARLAHAPYKCDAASLINKGLFPVA
jgi:hypothetical protein